MATPEKILEDKKVYLKTAVKNMPQEYFLDSWWQYLAENKIWYSRPKDKDPEPKPVFLYNLENTHLYNIRNCVIRISGDHPGRGAMMFIGLLSTILEENAKKREDKDECPF
jgi:hypothetical protein